MSTIGNTYFFVKLKALLLKVKHLLKKVIFFGKKVLLKVRCIIFRIFRDYFRNNEYYPRAKRVLIYNIFEGKESLQEYKIIFLEALAKIVDVIYIVVNGDRKSVV